MDFVDQLIAPTDADLAYGLWKANCGPAALAAGLRREVMSLRSIFPQFPEKAFTTVTAMKEAISGCARLFSVRQLRQVPGALPIAPTWPAFGLIQIQWTGPWTEPGMNPKWAWTHTHWIAAVSAPGDPRANRTFAPKIRAWVYDVNADHTTISDPQLSVLRPGGGGWITADDWMRFMPPIFLESIKRSSGFFCRFMIEVNNH